MIVVRKASTKDIPRIKKINDFDKILKKCSLLDRLDSSKNLNKEPCYYEKFIRGKKKWLYIAEEEHELIGFVLFNIEKRESFWKIKKVGYVDLLFVAKKARKKGVSKMLLDKAYSVFRDNKMKYVKLSVQTLNEKAHDVWKKHGFTDFLTYMYKKI